MDHVRLRIAFGGVRVLGPRRLGEDQRFGRLPVLQEAAGRRFAPDCRRRTDGQGADRGEFLAPGSARWGAEATGRGARSGPGRLNGYYRPRT
ncbi:hypothetical protein SSTG_05685 [Streptomyces sp. e14]|nr:hypothetical protein SSTG_05685 [Streptomyces sp. e14]